MPTMVSTTTTIDWDQVARRIEDVRNLARAFAGEARSYFGARLRDRERLFAAEVDREGIPL